MHKKKRATRTKPELQVVLVGMMLLMPKALLGDGLTWIWAVTQKGRANGRGRSRGQQTQVIHCSDPTDNVDEKLKRFLATSLGDKLHTKGKSISRLLWLDLPLLQHAVSSKVVVYFGGQHEAT